MSHPIINLSSYRVKEDERNKVPMRDFKVHLLAASKSEATINKRIYDLSRLAKEHDLYEVKRQDVEEFLAQLRELAPETRRGMLASWKQFYGWAHKTGRIDQDPTEQIEAIPVPRRLPRVAPDEAIMNVIHRVAPHVKAMILLARLGCLRLSEIASLPQSARDRDQLTFVGKGDKERTIFLHPDFQHSLVDVERMNYGEHYYFPGRFGGHMHPMSINKIITRETGWNPHSLRHAGATAAYRSTKDLRAVQQMLGHASLATTQRYLHVDEDGLRAAALGTSMSGRHLRIVA